MSSNWHRWFKSNHFRWTSSKRLLEYKRPTRPLRRKSYPLGRLPFRQYSSVWQSTGLIFLWSVVQIHLLPCVVSLVVKTGDCESLYEGSIPSRHPIEKSSNGRTPPFEGVYLGSSPSFSASPIDGIGIHTCLRNKVLQVRVLYRAPCWISVTVARWSPKPLVKVQIFHPSPCPFSSVD